MHYLILFADYSENVNSVYTRWPYTEAEAKKQMKRYYKEDKKSMDYSIDDWIWDTWYILSWYDRAVNAMIYKIA